MPQYKTYRPNAAPTVPRLVAYWSATMRRNIGQQLYTDMVKQLKENTESMNLVHGISTNQQEFTVPDENTEKIEAEIKKLNNMDDISKPEFCENFGDRTTGALSGCKAEKSEAEIEAEKKWYPLAAKAIPTIFDCSTKPKESNWEEAGTITKPAEAFSDADETTVDNDCVEGAIQSFCASNPDFEGDLQKTWNEIVSSMLVIGDGQNGDFNDLDVFLRDGLVKYIRDPNLLVIGKQEKHRAVLESAVFEKFQYAFYMMVTAYNEKKFRIFADSKKIAPKLTVAGLVGLDNVMATNEKAVQNNPKNLLKRIVRAAYVLYVMRMHVMIVCGVWDPILTAVLISIFAIHFFRTESSLVRNAFRDACTVLMAGSLFISDGRKMSSQSIFNDAFMAQRKFVKENPKKFSGDDKKLKMMNEVLKRVPHLLETPPSPLYLFETSLSDYLESGSSTVDLIDWLFRFPTHGHNVIDTRNVRRPFRPIFDILNSGSTSNLGIGVGTTYFYCRLFVTMDGNNNDAEQGLEKQKAIITEELSQIMLEEIDRHIQSFDYNESKNRFEIVFVDPLIPAMLHSAFSIPSTSDEAELRSFTAELDTDQKYVIRTLYSIPRKGSQPGENAVEIMNGTLALVQDEIDRSGRYNIEVVRNVSETSSLNYNFRDVDRGSVHGGRDMDVTKNRQSESRSKLFRLYVENTENENVVVVPLMEGGPSARVDPLQFAYFTESYASFLNWINLNGIRMLDVLKRTNMNDGLSGFCGVLDADARSRMSYYLDENNFVSVDVGKELGYTQKKNLLDQNDSPYAVHGEGETGVCDLCCAEILAWLITHHISIQGDDSVSLISSLSTLVAGLKKESAGNRLSHLVQHCLQTCAEDIAVVMRAAA